MFARFVELATVLGGFMIRGCADTRNSTGIENDRRSMNDERLRPEDSGAQHRGGDTGSVPDHGDQQ